MKKLCALLALMCLTNTLIADDYFVPYQIELHDGFLMGQDSQNIIFHNGNFIQKIKIKRHSSNIVKVSFFIPCFSGRRLTAEEKLEEMTVWNGTSFNLYYEDSRQMITVPVISTNIFEQKIVRDSTYKMSFSTVPVQSHDLEQFRGKYLKFVTLDSRVQQSGLQSILRHPHYSKTIWHDYLAVFRHADFTVVELENRFKIKFDSNGQIELGVYVDGSRVNAIRMESNGTYVSKMEYE